MNSSIRPPKKAASTEKSALRSRLCEVTLVLLLCVLGSASGCWAPLRSHGIPARCLPDSFRTPIRTAGAPLNYSNLTIQPPADYILGANDILEITVPGLFDQAEVHPIRVQVMASGEIQLPLVGPVIVGGKNLQQAQENITAAYSKDFLVDPRVSVTLAEKSSTSILVLGKVQAPGVHILPKFENDVGHALAAAGGLLEESADVIEIHRRIPMHGQPMRLPQLSATEQQSNYPVHMARFEQVSPGLTCWVPDGAPEPEHVALKLNSPTSAIKVSKPLAVPTQQGTDRPALQLSEPWPAPQSNIEATPITPQAMGDEFDVFQPTPGLPEVARAMHPGRPQYVNCQQMMPPAQMGQYAMSQEQRIIQGDKQILRIPLRQTGPSQLSKEDISLQPGDVVVVPSRRHEVFFVVGQLNTTNNVRFTIGDREREIGVGFILPREREIDVVTAVVMAGYIDPINSPTTVTVHRVGPDGKPLLIHVDLIKARYDSRETVLVQAGDIIYLNPDSCWWFRRTFDRIVPSLILEPYKKGIGVRNRN